MAKYIASRLVGTFLTKTGGTEIFFGITGFSVTGGDRNMIDITTGADDRRFSFGGLAAPLTATINFIYQGEITDLDTALVECGQGQLWIQSTTDAGDCALGDIIGTNGSPADGTGMYVYCTGYQLDGELDGAVTGTVNFERTAAPPED